MAMSLQSESIAAHPEFPWLEAGDAAGVQTLLARLGCIREGDTVVECGKAGEGNMNLTLRVRTERGAGFILKQARPWVEKYPSIAAPWDRNLFEQRFYARVSNIPDVSTRMPAIVRADDDARVIVMQDLGEASDFTDLYTGGALSDGEILELAAYARALHDGTRGQAVEELANREMRALNHAHIFEVPLQPDNGIELEAHEPGLTVAAKDLRNDQAYCVAVREVGVRYLEDGPCLVHGDYFPGSWLRTADGVKVIDPEFCFFGDAEFDLGVCIAHLRMGRQELEVARRFLEAYGAGSYDEKLVARYAAVETMRRLIGVAQLPIPPTEGQRAEWLHGSREALLRSSLEALWT